MRKFCFGLYVAFLILFPSCETGQWSLKNGSEISVSTWNLQTFFDGTKDGCEYSEFLKNGSWDKEKYYQRLERLCTVMKEINADIFVFEEIENEKILFDISNQFSAWKNRQNWKYSCFTKSEGSSIGCAVISRFPLFNLKTHSITVETANQEQPSLRYLMEVTAQVGEKQIVIFANHWKSKAGGEEESEIWRDYQESLLCQRLNEYSFVEDAAIISCGDFNRDIGEFFTEGNKVFFHNDFVKKNYFEPFCMESPWLTKQGDFSTVTGSYYFQQKWERIDHFFVYGNLEVVNFQVWNNIPLVNEDGIPYEYRISNGQGYSDHLPLLIYLRI